MLKMNGILALALCSFFWSTGGILVKLVNLDPFAIAGSRSFFAFLTILLIKRKLPAFIMKDENGNTDKAETLSLWLGGFCYSACMITFVLGNKLTTAANTILLQYTGPVYIIMFGPLLLGEKNKFSDYLCCLGVFAGMILFFSGKLDSGKLLGNVISIISGVFYGFTTIFMRRQKKADSINAFLIAHLITMAVGFPFLVTKGLPDLKGLCGLLLLGVFQMAIPSVTYSIGIKKVRALTASFITMIEPLFNPVWVALFAKELPGLMCVLGGVVILLSIMGRTIWQHQKAKENVSS